MTQITVTSVEEKHGKDGTKLYYQVWDNVLSYTTRNKDVLNLQSGSVIETTVKVNGKYRNFDTFTVVAQTNPPAKITATSPITPQHVGIPVNSLPLTVSAELDSKARNTALMQACEMAKTTASAVIPGDKPITIPDVLSCAEQFYRWLRGEALKTPIPTTDTAKTVKTPPVASSKTKTTPYEDTPAGRSALVSDYVRKGMPLANIYETLGIKTPAEIIDIDEAVKTLEAHTAKKV